MESPQYYRGVYRPAPTHAFHLLSHKSHAYNFSTMVEKETRFITELLGPRRNHFPYIFILLRTWLLQRYSVSGNSFVSFCPATAGPILVYILDVA
jgi:hypothetical protein